MNKFLAQIFFDNSMTKRALPAPLMAAFHADVDCFYHASRIQTKYEMRFGLLQEIWVDENKEHDHEHMMRVKQIFIKGLEKLIFGEVEIALHELEMHLHNQDWEKAKTTLEIARSHMRGY